MTEREKRQPTGAYAIGYCKPPVQTRFRKGQSGNPRGRPRGMTAGRAIALALKEAYRPVTVRDGERTRTMSALQAVLRSQVALAAKGNAAAQRTVFATVQAIEGEAAAQAARERAAAAAADPAGAETAEMDDLEVAKRIAFLLTKPLYDKGRDEEARKLSQAVAQGLASPESKEADSPSES